MTSRYQYGGDVSDFTYTPKAIASSVYMMLLPNAVTTFWSAQSGGTRWTDLLDANGNPVTSITTDGNANLPIFQGPAGVTAMWADAGGGRRLIRPTGSGSSLDADTAVNVGNPASATAMQLAATFASGQGTGSTTRAQIITGPTLPTLPAGTEYVWNKTNGSGLLLDIVSGVA